MEQTGASNWMLQLGACFSCLDKVNALTVPRHMLADARLMAGKAVEVAESAVGSWLLMLALGLVLALLWAKLTNNLEPLQSHFSKLLSQTSPAKQPT